MPTRVFVTADFSRFARKARIGDDALIAAIDRADRGLVDADLGGGLVKLRIARPGEGRRDGFRTIIAYREGTRAFFLFGFAKNEMGNVGDVAERGLREFGDFLQSRTDDQIRINLEDGTLREIAQ